MKKAEAFTTIQYYSTMVLKLSKLVKKFKKIVIFKKPADVHISPLKYHMS